MAEWGPRQPSLPEARSDDGGGNTKSGRERRARRRAARSASRGNGDERGQRLVRCRNQGGVAHAFAQVTDGVAGLRLLTHCPRGITMNRHTEAAPPPVTVAVVSYNTKRHLDRCLASVFREGRSFPVEVIVVDNASTDGSADMVRTSYPEVVLIESKENLGYGRGANLAFSSSNGRIFLLLNSDVELEEGCLARLADFLKKRLVGQMVVRLAAVGHMPTVDLGLKRVALGQKRPVLRRQIC